MKKHSMALSRNKEGMMREKKNIKLLLITPSTTWRK
jgi:hypothetical protein